MRYVKFVKIVLGTFLAVFLICNLLLFAAISVEKTVTQAVTSPDGAYEAYVLSSDEGALGGSTSVRVKRLKKTGIFQRKDKRLQLGEWGETYDLMWIDDNTLSVNSVQTYDMESIW